MADEKTLFNRNIDNDENSESKEDEVQLLADDDESDFVDFSAAFDGDDDSDVELEDEDDYEDYRPAPTLFRGLSFLRKRRNRDDLPIEDKVEETKEDVLSATEEIENSKQENKDEFEKSVDEETIKGKSKNKKSSKRFSPFAKKEKEPESDVENKNEAEEITEEQPVEEVAEETVAIVNESNDVEETDGSDDEVVLLEDDEEQAAGEIEDNETVVEEPKEEKRRFQGFGFLKRKIKESPEQPEYTDEESTEDSEETEFEMILSFEESTREVKGSVEESEQVEDVVETAEEEAEESVEFDEIPPFEVTFEENDEETFVEETAAEQVEFIPLFEPVTEEREEVSTESTEEKIDEIPPFEATIEEIYEEPSVEETTEDQVEFIPPFEPVIEERVEEVSTESAEEKIDEIPPFEATVEENYEEGSKEQHEAVEEEKTGEEKSNGVVLTTKDHLTFILIILALLLTIVFIVVKFIPLGNGDTQNSGVVTQAKDKVTEIQLQHENAVGHYIQSDIDDVFYVYSSEYSPEFYQYNGKKMKSVKIAGTVNPVVTMGNEKISVKVDYVEAKGELFGTGVFQKTGNQANYLNDIIVFKLVSLPKGYEQDGKALLLATNNSEAVSKRCSMWTDSYIIDLESGETTRFLTSDNSIYSAGYSILTDEGYESTNGEIPFFSTRDYDGTTNKRDIYLKIKGKETRFATDVAGSFVYTDGNAVSYLKVTDNGFNVVRKENGKEKVIFSLDNNTSYLYHNEYLLDKYNGNLYNVKSGEKIVVTGYGMSNPEMMAISSDGRYLVVVGAVNSAIDYQVHVFDLKTGECAKYVDDNFSQHKNLAFVNDTTIIYSAVEPKQGYEYVMLDVSKAF